MPFLIFLLFLMPSVVGVAKPSSVVARVAGQSYEFHRSDFKRLDLRKTELYKQLFKRPFYQSPFYALQRKRTLDINSVPGVRPETFSYIHQAISTGHGVMPRSADGVRDLCAEDLKTLGLEGYIKQPLLWSDVRQDDASGMNVYILEHRGVEFEFIRLPGEQSEVYVMSHWMTQKQWSALMRKNPSHFQGDITSENFPVENVSFRFLAERMIPYAQSVLHKQGFDGQLDLPSQDQWLALAHGNMPDDFSENSANYAHCNQDWSTGKPCAVQALKRGVLGARVCGFSEWVHGGGTALLREIRGGGLYDPTQSVGPMAVDWYPLDQGARFIGFRLVRSNVI